MKKSFFDLLYVLCARQTSLSAHVPRQHKYHLAMLLCHSLLNHMQSPSVSEAPSVNPSTTPTHVKSSHPILPLSTIPSASYVSAVSSKGPCVSPSTMPTHAPSRNPSQFRLLNPIGVHLYGRKIY